MVNVTFSLDGTIRQDLRFIDQDLINRATVKALRSLARPVYQDVRSEAPADTHTLSLSQSMSSVIDKRNGVAVVYVGLSKRNHPAWLINRGLAMEYGNRRVREQPYLGPAADKNRTPVYNDFRRFMDGHLDKLVARS